MSARQETEKRLRPRNSPYRRNHFDQSKYLRVPANNSQESEDHLETDIDLQQDDSETETAAE